MIMEARDQDSLCLPSGIVLRVHAQVQETLKCYLLAGSGTTERPPHYSYPVTDNIVFRLLKGCTDHQSNMRESSSTVSAVPLGDTELYNDGAQA